LYGSPFLTSFGDEPSTLWCAAIDALSDAELAAGLNRLVMKPREFSINLTQFVAACRPPPEPVRFLGVPITTAKLDAQLQLDAPRDPEIAHRHLANMRKYLGT
jgi:hypothetical protein